MSTRLDLSAVKNPDAVSLGDTSWPYTKETREANQMYSTNGNKEQQCSLPGKNFNIVITQQRSFENELQYEAPKLEYIHRFHIIRLGLQKLGVARSPHTTYLAFDRIVYSTDFARFPCVLCIATFQLWDHWAFWPSLLLFYLHISFCQLRRRFGLLK